MQFCINCNDLRYFLAIHRAGSLSAAARGFSVNQSTARVSVVIDWLGEVMQAVSSSSERTCRLRHRRGLSEHTRLLLAIR